MTSKDKILGAPKGAPIEIFIPVKPVSASRPRVSRFGSYYSKSYMQYRKDVYAFLKTIKDKYPVDDEAIFKVEIEFIHYRPSRPSRANCPRYDVDNLIKAPLDAITYTGMIWKDDIQIVEVQGFKRYQEKGEAYGTKIKITAYN